MPTADAPTRMTLTDLQTDETVEAMFNPTELQRRVAVNYAKKPVLGNSHQEHEYLQTDNMSLRFDLFFLAETPTELAKLKDSERFLESLCYSDRDPESIAQAAPPRVLVVWPRTLSIVGRVLTIDINYQRWNRFGDVTQFTATLAMEESRVRRLSKQDVRLLGALRTPQSQGKLIE